ncbi:hypothetical protein J9317_03620 [Metabacillus sp. KIGAM252]|uniref:DUF3862 domain-containing protein n=1 Tax=Metabacillus flavus TaxID=2823519 RepID=A0ABS5LBE1_9BACI|nr:hypothetical protein [Metabacillus flavus]MBS2967863.1 hypothetical protein [Metabacillus flavus]
MNRKSGFLLVAAISIWALAACGDAELDKKSEPAAAEEGSKSDKKKEEKKTEEKAPEKENTITLAQYEKAKGGMTYEEVTALFGSKGELVGDDKGDGNITYKWMGAEKKLSSAMLFFEENKLATKQQARMGLESTVKATKAQFDQVKEGMNMEQIEKIMGGKGSIGVETDGENGEFKTVQYVYDAEDEDIYYYLKNGILQSKSYGLTMNLPS